MAKINLKKATREMLECRNLSIKESIHLINIDGIKKFNKVKLINPFFKNKKQTPRCYLCSANYKKNDGKSRNGIRGYLLSVCPKCNKCLDFLQSSQITCKK